ncbi:MAG: hypothetical protein NDJ89_04465 [Oligoflexia bacterium]|nr:hypothetical protein [Oligoflexia bacterium]
MENQATPAGTGTTQGTRRFRTNPVEIVIFLAAVGVFSHSVYKLFNDSPSYQAAALLPSAGNPVSEGRSPASVAPPAFANLDLRCDAGSEQNTQAAKVRLSGGLCGLDAATDPGKLIKTTVSNGANKFTATVFMDVNAAKFSTDYIPLNAGKNPIQVEFTYSGGKIVSQELVVNRN